MCPTRLALPPAKALAAAWPLAACLLLTCGCGRSDGPADGDGSGANPATADAGGTGDGRVVPPPTAAPRPGSELRLNLRPGERFPLLKTVEQSLVQETPRGPVENRSRLELLLAIHVEEIRDDGRMRLGVQYHRVRYSHDVAGEQAAYDSETVRGPVPLHLRGYHGLARNGFSFWLGPDNRIVELVGFRDFLERCVQDVPVDQRERIVSQLAETSGEDGLANFVDDSIGLLPYEARAPEAGRTVHVGDGWSREQRFQKPVPVFVANRCTLRALDEDTAEIDILGTIANSTPFVTAGGSGSPLTVTVRGGNAFGTCRIRRETGLPIESHIERFFDMTVTSAGAPPVEQRKRVVTRIRTFPAQPAVETAVNGSGPVLR